MSAEALLLGGSLERLRVLLLEGGGQPVGVGHSSSPTLTRQRGRT